MYQVLFLLPVHQYTIAHRASPACFAAAPIYPSNRYSAVLGLVPYADRIRTRRIPQIRQVQHNIAEKGAIVVKFNNIIQNTRRIGMVGYFIIHGFTSLFEYGLLYSHIQT